jgi:hypothetical protein
MGLPLDLGFRTKGQLATDICADCWADGLEFDFACGDEVYGGCTRLRKFFEGNGHTYVLRVASSFMATFAQGTKVTCADAVKKLLKDKRRWESARLAKAPRANGGTPGPGSPPPHRGITCWCAVT